MQKKKKKCFKKGSATHSFLTDQCYTVLLAFLQQHVPLSGLIQKGFFLFIKRGPFFSKPTNGTLVQGCKYYEIILKIIKCH